ncbi:hypothetical protein Herbaro_16270 [Herbaspirillum sp. WKF16]|uniref:hypothetical protein n=1 Tax=Herbaspirillum sp. WKF16 TaxID=3028312 RepID=UPI0023A96C4A|nr:hypothetical protein [Herbaspirillum sp. WKF16]WDZ95030.1 hypothetical protein Herbaro_16270 [Herbaspirillum sp. WKF16]
MATFIYEHQTNDAEFLYRLWYSEHPEGWIVDGAQIVRRGESVVPKRALDGKYVAPADAIAYGLRWCETIAAYLQAESLSTDEWADRLLEGTKSPH